MFGLTEAKEVAKINRKKKEEGKGEERDRDK